MQSSCRLGMGREPLGPGVGVGRKAGKKLPDLRIHPPLGLIHLGDREREDGENEQRDRKDTMKLSLLPGDTRPSQLPTSLPSVHKCQCPVLRSLYLAPWGPGGATWKGPRLRGETHTVGAPGKRGADGSAQLGQPRGHWDGKTTPWASCSKHAHGTSPGHSCFWNVSQGQHWSGVAIRLGPDLRENDPARPGPQLKALWTLLSGFLPWALDPACPWPGLELPVIAAVPGPCPVGAPGSSQLPQLPATAPLRGMCGSDGQRAQGGSDPPKARALESVPLPMDTVARKAHTVWGERCMLPSPGWHAGVNSRHGG